MEPQTSADLNAILSRVETQSRLVLDLSTETSSCSPWLYQCAYSLFEGVALLINAGEYKLNQSTSTSLLGQKLLHISFAVKGAKYWQDNGHFAKLNSIYVKSLHKDSSEDLCMASGRHLGFSFLVTEAGIENLIKVNGLSLNTGATLLKLIASKQTQAQEFYTSIESKALASQLFEMLQMPKPNALELNALIYSLSEVVLNDIATGVMAASESNRYTALDILSCKDLIDNASDLSLTTANLAHMYDVSEATLNRHFKNVFGETVSSYLKKVRFDYAKAKLLEKDTPLISLAMKLGYSDMASFSRAFKKHFGVPPSQIHDLNREND